jgi:hypothetical protein
MSDELQQNMSCGHATLEPLWACALRIQKSEVESEPARSWGFPRACAPSGEPQRSYPATGNPSSALAPNGRTSRQVRVSLTTTTPLRLARVLVSAQPA